MNQEKVKIRLSDESAASLGCLLGRAQLSKEYSSLFYDAKAVELAEKIDYDFSTSNMPFRGIMFNLFLNGNLPQFNLFMLRAKQFDDKLKVYITEHPRASVVNIGAGLDTTFYRVDNGIIHWYDLDLPAVIDVRKQLLPEPDRVTYIAKSLLDPSWCDDIEHTDHGVFLVAGGVLPWFNEPDVKQFFSTLADNFPGSEIVFDAVSRVDNGVGAWIDMFPPGQRDAMRAAWMDALKDWWERAPQDQKDKLINLIATLRALTKPKGKKWADLELWWDQLSSKERDQALHDFIASSRSSAGGWTLEDANEITKWDSRITVIDQFPIFRNIPRDSLGADIRTLLDYSDKTGRSNIFHLRL